MEIDDGCVEHIETRAGDSPETVAMKFCLDHGLPEQFVAPLAEHIVSNIISLRSVAPLISSTLPSRASLHKRFLCLLTKSAVNGVDTIFCDFENE